MKKGFAECRKCKVWSYIPSLFDEATEFVQCPVCQGPMYLAHTLDPIKDLAMPVNKEVKAGRMLQ
jgi:hypothetical protein